MPDENVQQPVQPVPTAKVEKMRWPFPLIWIVPLLALGLAGYFFYQRHQEQGFEIVIRFTDGGGLKESQTVVSVAGVVVGHVHAIDLDNDHKTVLVHVRLEQKNAFLAKAGTQFWVVRPELSLSAITGLNTIVSGPYIDVKPGDGADTRDFTGLPGMPRPDVPGVHLLLYADQIGHVTEDSQVQFRGIQVGSVKQVRLGDDASAAAVDIVIWDRYKNIVRTKSVFWVNNGADLKGSLLGGVKLELGSVQSLLVGSVAFATPEKDVGVAVKDGDLFELHDQAKEEWLHWRTPIQMPVLPKTPAAKGAGAQLPGLKHE